MDWFNLSSLPPDQVSRVEHWRSFVGLEAAYIHMNINFNLSGKAVSRPPLRPLPSSKNSDATQIDLVSLCISSDFRVLFQSRGMLTFFRHIRNYRSLTLVGREAELPLIRKELYANREVMEVGKEVAGARDRRVPAIHFVSESYFKERYKDRYDCPYPKACQQFMKLFIFDVPFLLDNVLVVDSDTAWGKDITFVHKDGTVTYVNECERKECHPHDAFRVVNTLFNPNNTTFSEDEKKRMKRDKKGLSLQDTGCRFDRFCGRSDSSGCRHILHHMLFQRDVMLALHKDVNALWGGSSFWESFMTCWETRPCQGRVSEYEIYYSYVSCKYPERVRDERFDFRNAAGDCSEEEMDRCREKGVLLKGCHDHRKKDQAFGLC